VRGCRKENSRIANRELRLERERENMKECAGNFLIFTHEVRIIAGRVAEVK
jgi:hypothetical protein